MRSMKTVRHTEAGRLGWCRYVVALLAALAVLITGAGIGPRSTSAAERAYNPDAPAVEVTSGVTMDLFRDTNHTQPFDPAKDQLVAGNSLFGRLSFKFTDANKPTLDSPVRSYTFPTGSITVPDVAETDLHDAAGNVAGRWWIKDGKAYGRWSEQWLNSHPSDITSFISFSFTLNGDGGLNGNKETVTFPGVGDITITIDKTHVEGTKQITLGNDGTATFSIVLKNRFDVPNMVVTDTMGENFVFVPGAFQLDGTKIADDKVVIEGQKATISLGNLAKTEAPDGAHQLTYKVRLTDEARQLMEQGKYLPHAGNSATWGWTGVAQGGSASVSPYFYGNMLEKSDGVGTNTDITWTVTLNGGDPKADMGGYVFRDDLHGNHHYIGSYTIRDESGTVFATGELPKDAGATSFNYTFPADAGRRKFTIEYHTAYNDPTVGTKVSNDAYLRPGAQFGDIAQDGGSYTPKENEIVSKTEARDWDQRDIIDYTINVNKNGADLVKGSDTITLTDTMDADFTFLPATLKIVKTGTNEVIMAKVELDDITDAQNNPAKKLTVELPDATPITITYGVRAIGPVGSQVQLTNRAEISGVVNGASTTDTNWFVFESSAGTAGTGGVMAITKVDSASLSRKLAGAQFTLYKVDMNQLTGTNVTDAQVAAASTQVGQQTTDDSGVARFGTKAQPLETSTLFYFTETKAPTYTNADGSTVDYELDTSPHYFMLEGSDGSAFRTAFNRAKGFGLPVSEASEFTVQDKVKPKPVEASVSFGKQLTGRAWKADDEFEFTLAADTADGASEDVTADEVTAAMPSSKTVTVRKGTDGADGAVSKFSFGPFTFKKAGTYAYTVQENGSGIDGVNGMTTDKTVAKVTFTVAQQFGELSVKTEVTGLKDDHGVPTFVNTYKPNPVSVRDAIKVRKNLSGRDWKSTDSFEFRLAPDSTTPDAPLPEGTTGQYASVTVSDANEHAFGEITYTKAGVYHYDLYEHTPTGGDGKDAIPGIDYSNALYDVTVTVTDDGKGQLVIDQQTGVIITKKVDDKNVAVTGSRARIAVTGGVAEFTNTYSADDISFGLLVTKRYTDESGAKPLKDGMFSFTLARHSSSPDAPLPASATDGKVVAQVAKDGTVSFPAITYTSAHDADKTYEYTLKENVPAEATTSADGKTATLNGMTYDLTEYRIRISIGTTVDADGTAVLKQSLTVLDAQGNPVDPNKDPGKLDENGRPTFTNRYAPQPTEAAIAGRKTLTGRDMANGEQFTFQLAAAGDNTDAAKATRNGLADDSIVFGTDTAATTMSQTVTDAKDGEAKSFTFAGIHFTKPGSYKFKVSETGDVKAGTTKDEHVSYATVTVKDNGGGTLVVGPITYVNSDALTDGDKTANDAAAFTNTYAPTGSVFFLLHKTIAAQSGITAPKLTAGQFSFALYAGGSEGGSVTGTPLQTKKNIAPEGGAAFGNITFDRISYTPAALNDAVTQGYATYDAAARTWKVTYTVVELGPDGKPATESTRNGDFFYDTQARTVTVTVHDRGDGVLQTSYAISVPGGVAVPGGDGEPGGAAVTGGEAAVSGGEAAPGGDAAPGNARAVDLTAADTFRNMYLPGVAALPMTGGLGTARAWALAGGALVVASGIALALIDRRRRRV